MVRQIYHWYHDLQIIMKWIYAGAYETLCTESIVQGVLFFIGFFKMSTRTIINRGYYFFSSFCDVGFSLMFGGIPLKLRGY